MYLTSFLVTYSHMCSAVVIMTSVNFVVITHVWQIENQARRETVLHSSLLLTETLDCAEQECVFSAYREAASSSVF